MKKIYLTALCVIALSGGMNTALAQDKLRQAITDVAPDWMPPFKFGVTAGLNSSTFSHSGFDAKCGFQVGLDAMVDMSTLIDNTYLRTGLQVVRKGAKWDEIIYGNYMANAQKYYDRTIKHRPVYLQIPIRYGYGYVVEPDCIFYGEAGPYVALGVGGKSRVTDRYYNADSRETTFDFFDYADRFDFGFGLHAGIIICKHHQLGIGYDFGLLNMSDAYAQNRSLMLSYTYYIK